MYSDFSVGYYLFGGGYDRLFGDAILCASLLYFCGLDGFIVGVFIIVVVSGDGGGFGAGALATESAAGVERYYDGAAGAIYFAISGANFGASANLGGGDDSDYFD